MITSALHGMAFRSVPSPDLRIPFNGGADTKDVRTACEVGRGRDVTEGSSAEEYPPSSAEPRGWRRRIVCVLRVVWGGGGNIAIGGINGLPISGNGQGLIRGARGAGATPQVAWLLLDIVW